MFYVERLESYQGLRFSSRVSPPAADPPHQLGQGGRRLQPRGGGGGLRRGLRAAHAADDPHEGAVPPCLAETRERGYAFSIEEDEPGLASVAAPVLDRTRVARAAISVAGPVSRVSGDHIRQMARRVLGAANQLMSRREQLVERDRLPLICSFLDERRS